MRKLMMSLAAVALLAAAPALANDSSAELAAGGLILTHDDDIEMRSEDLFISRDEVVVKYRFLNTSNADKTIRVAFPMPDIEFSESPMPALTDDPVNLLGFVTTVDGQPVHAEVEQKAMQDEVDVTARLRALHIPLAPHMEATWAALDALPQADKDALEHDELVWVEEYDQGDGRGMVRHLMPHWRLTTTFHWEQTFPAGRELAVEHRYHPATGGSAGTVIGSPYHADPDPETAAYLARFCVDADFQAAVRARMAAEHAEYPPFYESRVSYVLHTGANWAKPIGHFRLVVDKGAAENLVSFCATGVRKISPTRFEVVHDNFRPDHDLDILILYPIPPVQ
jgi:hypothetical protein